MAARRTSSRDRASRDDLAAHTGQTVGDGMTMEAYLDLSAKMVGLQVQLAAMNEKLASIPDHEARIRQLEAAKAKAIGVCLLLGTLAGSASGWVPLLVTHH